MNELALILELIFSLSLILFSLRWGKEATVVVVILLSLLANLNVLQQFPVFGLFATGGDAFAVGELFGMGVIQECFGSQAARRTTGLLCLILVAFTVATQLNFLFHGASSEMSRAYYSLFQHTPRLLAASFLTSFVSNSLLIRLHRYFRCIHSFARASVLSNVLVQIVDTALFALLGLFGVMDHIVAMILCSIFIKWILIAIMPLMLRMAKSITSHPAYDFL